MIGPINHIAIAVPDLAAASERYRAMLGATVSEPQALEAHGVSVVFVEGAGGATKVELLEPLRESSPIAAFLERNPSGGMHHICYEVADIDDAVARLEAEGARLLGPPKIGAHGNRVVFVHPKVFDGTLVELEEVGASM